MPGAKRVVLFEPTERTWIRHELGTHFGEPPDLANGFLLKTWKSGPDKGKAKSPPAVRTMVDRGLLEIRPVGSGFRVFFTDAGLAGLRNLLADKRSMNSTEFGHLYCQLGLPASHPDAAT